MEILKILKILKAAIWLINGVVKQGVCVCQRKRGELILEAKQSKAVKAARTGAGLRKVFQLNKKSKSKSKTKGSAPCVASGGVKCQLSVKQQTANRDNAGR